MRLILAAVTLSIHAIAFAADAPDRRQVWQPVQEYFIRLKPAQEPVRVAGKQRLNSFVAYTHLGTDFGFHGPAEHTIEWLSDEVCVRLGQEPDAWAGMWHSLAGLARDPRETMNFAAPWPALMNPRHQPRITGLVLRLKGKGVIKVEIKGPAQETLWQDSIDVQVDQPEIVVRPLPYPELSRAKLLNWTVEPGAEVCVGSVQLAVETPPVPFDEYIFAASYAKLARCYDGAGGFVKDRAHLENGALDSVPATGMFALATAVAAHPSLGIVAPGEAKAIAARIHHAVKVLPKAHGLLPHFVRRDAGGHYAIHEGTEYSTVDTAIFYQSLLLAARVLGDEVMESEVIAAVKAVDFAKLRLPGGHLSHGLKDDGETVLPHGWADWGGETALVLLLERLANEQSTSPVMHRPGQAWQGTGFITEIQSLFHPDFDTDTPDALDGVRWLSARRAMLTSQREYIQRTWPDSQAARMGLYGLSAGESEFGDAYHVGGTALPDQSLLHPHYVLMSTGLVEKTSEVYALLERMEAQGYFTPWGMVENATVTGSSYLPMNGALNAAFEALGAYHLLARHRQIPDAIYDASRSLAPLRRAMRLFYPDKTGTEPAPMQISNDLESPAQSSGQ